ncbi:nucleotidyltransferase domain-containing protein [Streptomyces globisporus]|uniref:nucleotidyltransferase domain-containing protein n=1 Tax=Streptomyces globisporus TaxID=1908 RepID=UPI0036DD9A1D
MTVQPDLHRRTALAQTTAGELLAAHPGAQVHLTGALAHGLAHSRSDVDLLLVTPSAPPPVTALRRDGIRIDIAAQTTTAMGDARRLLGSFDLPLEGDVPVLREVRSRMGELTRLRTALRLDGHGAAEPVLTAPEQAVYARWALADRLQEAITLTEDLAGLLQSGQVHAASVTVAQLGTVIAQAETVAAGQPLLGQKWLPALRGLAANPPTGPQPLPPLADTGPTGGQWGFTDIQHRLLKALFTCWGTPSGPAQPLPDLVRSFGWLPIACNEGFAAQFGEDVLALSGGQLLTWATRAPAPTAGG